MNKINSDRFRARTPGGYQGKPSTPSKGSGGGQSSDTSKFEALFERRELVDRRIEERLAAEQAAIRAAERAKEREAHAKLRAATLEEVKEAIARYEFEPSDLGFDES